MFKKTLLALAISGFAANAVAGADIATITEADAVTISIEGATSKAEVLGGDISVTTDAEYSVGDVLTFTIAGADVDPATAPTSINATAGAAAGGYDAADTFTLGLLSASSSVLTYRVTDLDTATGSTTIDAVFTITGLEYDTASLVTSGSATVAYAAVTSTGFAIDTGANTTADILTAEGQFGLNRTADDNFDAIIDVEADRVQFDDGDVIDQVEITITSDGALTYPATAVTFDIELTGSFAYLDTDDTTDGVQLAGGAFNPAPATITESLATFTGRTAGKTTIIIDAEGAVPATSDVVIELKPIQLQ